MKDTATIESRAIQVPHLTQDTTRKSDKNTIKHNTQESQEASPYQVAMNRKYDKHETYIHK